MTWRKRVHHGSERVISVLYVAHKQRRQTSQRHLVPTTKKMIFPNDHRAFHTSSISWSKVATDNGNERLPTMREGVELTMIPHDDRT